MVIPAGHVETNPRHDLARTVVEAAPVVRIEHREDLLTRMLEHQAARVPSNVFLFAAICAMVVSFAEEVGGRRQRSRFVGMWVGPLLTMGVYNKLVKMLGPR